MGVTLKADVPDDTMTIESWFAVYAGANWHERETHEMFGIVFAGHPDLRNMYLPTEFEGYPLRKDFPLLARMVKPWPGIVDVEPMPADEAPPEDEVTGDAAREPDARPGRRRGGGATAEDVADAAGPRPASRRRPTTSGRRATRRRTTPRRRIETVGRWRGRRRRDGSPSERQQLSYIAAQAADARLNVELETEGMTLNIGPQHPATHGTLRIIVRLDGEQVVWAEPSCGYMHRGYEKLTGSARTRRSRRWSTGSTGSAASPTRCRSSSPPRS